MVTSSTSDVAPRPDPTDVVDLPLDRTARPASTGIVEIAITLDAELVTRIRDIATRAGRSLPVALRAGLRAVLVRYTGQSELSIGAARVELQASDSLATLLAREDAAVVSGDAPSQIRHVHAASTDASSSNDLTLSTHDDGDRVRAVFRFRDQLDRAAIEQLARHYVRVLDRATRDPAAALLKLPLLDAAEAAPLTGEHATFPAACIHELFEAHARQQPDAVAVVYESEQRTYRQLDQESTALAHRLVALGVGPDDIVGLYLDRSIDFVVALLAVLKAGGAYVPLDPKLPLDRLSYMAETAHAKVVIAEGTGGFPGPWTTLRLGDARSDAAGQPALTGRAQPQHLAYVLFTSGSTGRPKGVPVEHRNLANYVHGVIRTLALTPGTSYATVTTLSGDVGNTAIFPALCGGGTLHIVAWARATSAAQLAAYVTEHRIDVLKAVPSLASALLDARDPSVLPRKMLVLGGEPLPWTLVDRVHALAPACRVFNSYGPTETTVAALMSTTDVPRLGANVPIGRPLPNQHAYILDPWGNPTPPGIAGELYIGGAGVTRGYVGRPDLTAERYVADPGVDEARVYRTGDRVRRLPDGAVEFLGRVDTQVKIRGYRVEPEEVAAVLRQLPGIDGGVVVSAEAHPGDVRLVAYAVTARGTTITDATVREQLARRVPDYMVPSLVVFVDRIPLTPNGKVDRRALPAPSFAATAPAPAPSAAQHDAGSELMGLVRELGLAPTSLDDDLFDLGAHSLILAQLLARIQRSFGVQLSIGTFFEHSTLTAIAEQIERVQR